MDLNQNNYETSEECKKSVFQAVAADDTGTVRRYLESGGDVNMTDYVSRSTLLHHAVEEKSYKCAVVLLNSGADISLKNGAGQSPLRLAQHLGDREGFILNIQLSVRKRREREKKHEKQKLMKEKEAMLKQCTNPALVLLQRQTRDSLLAARSILANLENQKKSTEALVRGLEQQLIGIEGQMLMEVCEHQDETANRCESPPDSVLNEVSKCCVCWERPQPFVFQCPQGHILCDSCLSRPELTLCPECRVPLDFRIRNRSLEALLNS